MAQANTDFGDGIRVTDGSADVDFVLRGGKYSVLVTATWGGGNLTLKGLAADDSTYVTVLTAFTADGYATVDLPAGKYRADITTATAVYLTIAPIPIRTHN